MAIIIKSATEIATLRQAGMVVASLLKILSRDAKAGITIRRLNKTAIKELAKYGATPLFKGYRGFPAALCVFINDEVVHGISGDRVIQEGDCCD